MVDIRFMSTQRSMGNPISLPVFMTLDGDLTLIKSPASKSVYIQPLMQFGFQRIKIEYSQPVVLNRFGLFPQVKDLGWIEVRRQRVEAGLGLSAMAKGLVGVGLTPYKGAMQTVIRNKTSSVEKSLPFKMPKELSELEKWNNNDMGTFQTYGGISAYVGLGVSIVDIATYSVGLQNQFIVEMIKESETQVSLKIEEENVKSRQWIFGPLVMQATFRKFDGKKFRANFTLDLTDPRHHQLFKEALKGNIKNLQKELPSKLQKLSWQGKDKGTYVGIPIIAGKQKVSGHYDLKEDEMDAKLDFETKMSKGILSPLNNVQNFSYQVDSGMVVVWTSEMKKTSLKTFDKNFFSKGRILGVKGFEKPVNHQGKFGSVVAQIGLFLSRQEIETLKYTDLAPLRVTMREKCIEEKLSCKKNEKLDEIFVKVAKLLKLPWEKMSGEFGILLLNEPALVHTIVKSLQYKKEVYFKFLSENYQSLEGSAPIEI